MGIPVATCAIYRYGLNLHLPSSACVYPYPRLTAPPPPIHRRLNDPKEIIGGFSFPITPPSEDALQKLYKSWPSVKSSSTSELHPNRMDDVSGSMAADYRDDGEALSAPFDGCLYQRV